MNLNASLLSQLSPSDTLQVPSEALLGLPEKVLQFGTGVLLRGLPDYFINEANNQGIFNGRIVVVKSTSQGGTDSFREQDQLFTQWIRGTSENREINRAVINASISRVLSAASQWSAILDCATNPGMQVIISNTTEVGIVLDPEDNIHAHPPRTFPGKLLAFLWKRYSALNGSPDAGMVIIPTELIPDNGKKLQEIVLSLAQTNRLGDGFCNWLRDHNDFCSSLVDRIVPGKLPETDQQSLEVKQGYTDELMIMSEVYRLWAIETSRDRTQQLLTFRHADKGVVLAPDINKFRELKLRLLNGSHTFGCGIAVLMGFTTVKEAMADPLFHGYLHALMYKEIIPAITGPSIPVAEAQAFADQVLDRFKNPFLDHRWLSISLQYSSKMKMRNLPLLQQYSAALHTVPKYMAAGLAAYLLFMKSEPSGHDSYTGNAGGTTYPINDDKAGQLHYLWNTVDSGNFAATALSDVSLWGTAPAALPGLTETVQLIMDTISTRGTRFALQELLQPSV